MCEVFQARKGIWFGTTTTAKSEGLSFSAPAPGVKIAEIPVARDAYRAFYEGYANSLLWPICHNRLDLAKFDSGTYRAYREVNASIAEAMIPSLRDDDVIWVHDYHLIPLGEELRRRGVRAAIGFFLHIPFPPGDVFAAVPQHEALARSLSHYDLVGFQTQKDVAALLNYIQRHLSGRILNDGNIRLGGEVMKCGAFPIGIDAADFARAAETEARKKRLASIGGGQVDRVIGVDRLDYSKGLTQRFRSVARFLERYPERQGRVTYTQIAPPTRKGLRAYADIQDELERLAGSINGRFASLDWMPIHYIHRAFPRKSLAGLYRRARAGLVTPTQDGMNLVAKEYVAAQDPADPGVLVLSKFAGAAEQLKSALLVNPHDEDDCAEKIEAALNMPLAERRDRYQEMFDLLIQNDVHSWSAVFLRELESATRQRRREVPDVVMPHAINLRPSASRPQELSVTP